MVYIDDVVGRMANWNAQQTCVRCLSVPRRSTLRVSAAQYVQVELSVVQTSSWQELMKC